MGKRLLYHIHPKSTRTTLGLAIISVSEKAYKRMPKVGHKGYYLDFKRVYEHHIKNGQYPYTPNTALMHAL
jgi:aspartate aminotransferase-like enzyme